MRRPAGRLEPFEAEVRNFALRHGMFEACDVAVVAVSGGPDSMAMLYALVRIGAVEPSWPELVVAHLDHKLRGDESTADAEFVSSAARDIGLRFVKGDSDVRAETTKRGGNLESVARAIRYEFLDQTARSNAACAVSTGHTASDQAETVLMRLARGTGVDGLSSIAPARPLGDGVRLVRPLLATTRASVLTYCHDRAISFRNDTSNADLHMSRAAVRHRVLPELERFAPGATANLARTANLAADDREYFEALVNGLFSGWGASTAGEIRIPSAVICELAPAILRRVLREAVRRAKGDLTRLTRDHVEAISSLLADGRAGRAVSLPGGLVARRDGCDLVVTECVEK